MAMLAAAVGACSPTGPVVPAVPVAKLEFIRPQAVPGEPLLVMAWVPAAHRPAAILVEAAGGGASTVLLLSPYADMFAPDQRFGEPWASMPAEELAAFIGAGEWIAIVGIVEEGAVREPGRSPTLEVSDATVERTMKWLRELGALEVTRTDPRFGYVSARLPPGVDLIEAIRAHPNVETLEPAYMMVFDDFTPEPYASSQPYVAVLRTAGAGALPVRAGDTITLRYRQPDGAMLSVSIPVAHP
jgi:hypothetical protein